VNELRVLFVEDQERDVVLLVRELSRGGYAPVYERVECADSMRAALLRGTWDLLISDYSMPRFSAPAALEVLQDSGLDIPFIIVSGTVDEEVAVVSMRAGAHDFMSKDRLDRLLPAIARERREVAVRLERRRAQEQLAAAQERLHHAQKMEALGRLASGIAHDFNNLLSAILGFAGLALDKLHEDDPITEDIREVCSAGERAAELTRQLLVFSRQQTLEPKALYLDQLIDGIDKMLTRLLGTNVHFNRPSSNGVGLVEADPGQLEQVVMNLVVNARDAMPGGGVVTIETRNVQLEEGGEYHAPELEPGPYVMLAVSDTGTGMDEAIRARIFEPFFTTKPQDKGTGLGLSIVFGIVRQSRGHIAVESTLGAGTTFRVFFPRIEGVVAEP